MTDQAGHTGTILVCSRCGHQHKRAYVPIDTLNDTRAELRRVTRAVERMAAAIDLYVHRRLLDARSQPADARLDLGDPMTEDEAAAILWPAEAGR